MADLGYSLFLALSRQFLQLVAKDTNKYTTQKSQIKIEGTKVVLFTPSHLQFAKYGRGPGKKPPLDPILQWVKTKGIVSNNKKQLGAAFAIQNSIGKRGTLNWVPNAPNALEESLNDNVDSYVKKLGAVFTGKINEQIEDNLKNVFPDRVEFKI